MQNPRFKPLLIGGITVAVVWALAMAGYHLAINSKMTPDKVVATLRSTDLNSLSAEARARRLREIAEQFNQLPREDRRRARVNEAWDPIWNEMTEAERGEFIERTMPTGFRQMITAFEQMPEDRRRAAITNTLARLQRARDQDEPMDGNTNRPAMSEELQKKVITTGLKTFYSESSAQTKAEMAPVLEEMQRLMENGQLFRRPR